MWKRRPNEADRVYACIRLANVLWVFKLEATLTYFVATSKCDWKMYFKVKLAHIGEFKMLLVIDSYWY